MSEFIRIEGAEAMATSPEGQLAKMSLADLLAKVAPQRMDTCGVWLPDGVKAVISEGPFTIWVYESPPRVHNFHWIAGDSPSPFGRGTKYRAVRIALPYLIVLAVFGPKPGGQLQLTGVNECFFRTAPLQTLDDELMFPALLNCSKFASEHGRPLSWICTQHLKLDAIAREPDTPRRLCASFNALRHCLLETGFNYSSEGHEGASWFTASRGVDPRVSTVEAWQEATAKDPLFVLDVPWLKTGRTVKQVAARTFKNLGSRRTACATAADLARVIFNQPVPAPGPRRPALELAELMHGLAQ